jgi:hypothetical protein
VDQNPQPRYWSARLSLWGKTQSGTFPECAIVSVDLYRDCKGKKGAQCARRPIDRAGMLSVVTQMAASKRTSGHHTAHGTEAKENSAQRQALYERFQVGWLLQLVLMHRSR